MFLEDVFYVQNVKGEPGVVPTQPPQASQEAAQLGRGPEPLEQRARNSQPDRAAQHQTLQGAHTTCGFREPESTLCLPAKSFICHIQEADLRLCVYLFISH